MSTQRCQCAMTLTGENEETENCMANCQYVAECARRFAPGHWSFLGPGPEKKWLWNSCEQAKW